MIKTDILENVNAIIATIELDGTMSYINKFGQNFTGTTKEKIASEPYFWINYLPNKIKPDIKQIVENASKNGTLLEKNQNPWVDKDGNEKMFEWSNSFEKNENGEIIRITTVGIDITENRRLQEELEKLNKHHTELLQERVDQQTAILIEQKNELIQSKYLIKDIIDNAPVRIFWKDLDGVYLGANKLFLKDAQLEDEDQILGKTDKDMVWSSVAHLYMEDDQKVMKSKISKLQYEEPQTYEDGSTIYLITSKIPLTDKDGNVYGILGVYDDITEQKLKDRRFLEQAKMASMGEMIGNISHQWRQPLSSISIAATSLLLKNEMNVLNNEELISELESINTQAQYLSSTIDTFKNYIRGNKQLIKDRVINKLKAPLALIEASLKNNDITLTQEYNDTDAIIETPEGEFSETIINIINNAKYELIDHKKDDRTINISTKQYGDNVQIIIEDNAGGIPEDILPRIFDPYFTTKHQSQGTGLGLHMCYKMVTESFGGTIRAENSTNGARFIIELPTIES